MTQDFVSFSDLNMLAESEGSDHLDFQEHSKGKLRRPSLVFCLCEELCRALCVFLCIIMTPLGDRPPRSPGVDPKQLAAELQKVSQQQAPTSTSSSGLPATTSATSSPGQPGSPSVSKKRHSSKASLVEGGLILNSGFSAGHLQCLVFFLPGTFGQHHRS